jgi:Fe-S cluster assembly protein SufD
MSTVLNKEVIIPAQLEAEFGTLLGKTFAAEPAWLQEQRRAAFDAFCKKGIPGKKNEQYKYSDVKKLFSERFTAIHNEAHALALDVEQLAIDKDSIKLVFVNGWLYRESTLSVELPAGVAIGSMGADAVFLHRQVLEKHLGSALAKSPSEFALLNAALWYDGAFICLPDNVQLNRNIEIIHICTGNEALLVSPRHLILAGKNSRAQVIEHSVSRDASARMIVNSLTEVIVGEGAHVNYYKVQDGNKHTAQLHTTFAVQARDSVFDTCNFTIDSAWVRNNLRIDLDGERCVSHLNGLFVTSGSEQVDNHTQVYHNKPNCESNQLYKGILDERSTGIFNGRIFVERDAQKTNAYQSSKNILLSDDATINTKPELEIYADDVKCSHGSSTGRLDEDALFYLRARGVGPDSARGLLLYAFANDALNTVRIDVLKQYLEGLVETRLSR